MSDHEQHHRSTPIEGLLSADAADLEPSLSVGPMSSPMISPMLSPMASPLATPAATAGPPPFRSTRWLMFVVGVATFVGLPFTYVFVRLTIGGTFTTGEPVPTRDRIVFAVLAAVAWAICALFARARMMLAADQLIAVNALRTHRVAWSEVHWVDLVDRRNKGSVFTRVKIGTDRPFFVHAASVSRSKRATLQPLFDACARHGVTVTGRDPAPRPDGA